MPPHVIAEQRRAEVIESSLRAVQESLDVDEVLAPNSCLLLGQPEAGTDIGRRLLSISGSASAAR
jgi:hypothetical protein